MTDQQVDDQGTTQEQAREMLGKMNEKFLSPDEFGMVLGRDGEFVENLLNGSETIDDDLVMKMRGIAKERNWEIE